MTSLVSVFMFLPGRYVKVPLRATLNAFGHPSHLRGAQPSLRDTSHVIYQTIMRSAAGEAPAGWQAPEEWHFSALRSG